MTKKQLATLFIINLALIIMASVVSALMPLYAAKFGADSTVAGLYLSCTAGSMGVGNILAGWLSNRLQRRKTVLIIAGVIEIAALWLMGQATNLGQLFLFTIATAVAFGVQITMVNILAGLYANETERGKVFGIIASAGALGGFIGGLAGGSIVDRWGYSGLFTAVALVAILQPAAGLFLEDKAFRPTRGGARPANPARSALLSATFLLLFVASTLAFVTNAVQSLGRSLLMDKLGFDAAAITSTVAVAGLVTLPFPLMLGWLSDRIGRKPLLVFCYLASTVSLIILVGSVNLWHFWVSTALQTLVGASLVVGAALVTDLLPQEALGSGLSLLGATNAIGLVMGNAATGAAIQNLGMVPTLVVSAALALIAAALLIPIGRQAMANTVTGKAQFDDVRTPARVTEQN